MPYLFTNIGATISRYPGMIFTTGVGSDINFKGRHTIYLAFGLGTHSVPGVEDSEDNIDNELSGIQLFAANFKIGYYF